VSTVYACTTARVVDRSLRALHVGETAIVSYAGTRTEVTRTHEREYLSRVGKRQVLLGDLQATLSSIVAYGLLKRAMTPGDNLNAVQQVARR
jgi:hypothetical protein